MYNTNAYNLFFFKTHSDLTDPTDFYCPADLEAPAKRGTALTDGAARAEPNIFELSRVVTEVDDKSTDGAARAEPNIFELSRVVTEVDDKSMQGAVNGLADSADTAEI